MTLKEIRDAVYAELDITTSRIGETVATSKINEAIAELQDQADAPHEQYTGSFDTVAGTASYAIADLFGASTPYMWKPLFLHYTNSDGDEVTLEQKTITEGYADFPPGSNSDAPVEYALFEGSIYLFPPPDAAYEVDVFCLVRQVLLSGDSDTNNWTTLEPFLVIAASCAKVCEWIEEYEAQSRYEAKTARMVTDAMVRWVGSSNGRIPQMNDVQGE